MFYYYGRKKQLARYYPSPNLKVIIEPFAGAAAYSLYSNNWKNKVILIEKDKEVADIWKWLIEVATPEDILNLTDLKIGDKTSNFLHILHSASKMSFKYKTIKVTPIIERNWEISKRFISENLYKIKHWEIINGDYTDAPNVVATWFIDPPYKGSGGMGYRHSSKNLNYTELASWILSRKGEVIACEGESGNYLPFQKLIDLNGVAGKKSEERIFYIINRIDNTSKIIVPTQTSLEMMNI